MSATTSQSSDPQVQTPLLPILSVNFIGTLGFSIVLPFLIFLVTRWGGNALIYAIIGATYSVFQLIGAPILGRWSDRFGRKKILLLSQLGTFTSWVLFAGAFLLPTDPLFSAADSWLGAFALSAPLLVLFIARALDGLTGGNISVANAYLADISTDENRNANFGRMAVSANLGFILGPAIAGLLGSTQMGELLPVLAALGISLVASLLIAFGLPESNPCAVQKLPEGAQMRKLLGQEQRECYELEGESRSSMFSVLRLPGIAYLLGIHFLVMLGFNVFYVSFPVHAAGPLAWDVGRTGVFFSIMALLMALVQGPILSWAAKRFSENSLVLFGSAVLAVSFPCFVFYNDILIFLGVAFLALGNGLMWPSFNAVLARQAGKQHQGAVQGFAGSSGAVASILGLLAGGLLYSILGSLNFVVSAAAITTVFVMSLRCLFMQRGEEAGAEEQT